MGQAKTCILFMAHYLNPLILKEYYKLQECCRFGFDVKFFYDNSRNDFPHTKFKDKQNVVLFTIESIQKRYTLIPYCENRRGPFYGNLIFPVLSFALDTLYQYIWRIEFDVRFSGKWIDFFNAFEPSQADLLGTTLCRFSSSPTWRYWKTAELDRVPIPDEKLIRGFFPVIRLSNKACVVLDRAYHNGWQGHFEVSIGTILHHFNCKIEDVGGNGEFVNFENRNRFYTNTLQNNFLWPGTFIWRFPEICMEHKLNTPNQLYHPITAKPWSHKLYCILKFFLPRISISAIKFAKRYFSRFLIAKKSPVTTGKTV